MDISIDTGLKTYIVNGGNELTFNPSDPALYNRFSILVEKSQDYEKKAREIEAMTDTVQKLRATDDLDKEIKNHLSIVFGECNDFDKILGKVSMMAVGSNGKYVLMNTIESLMHIIQEGVKEYAEAEAAREVAAMSE